MKTLLIATRNRHKVEEIKSILGGGFVYRTLADYENAPAIDEEADTFEGNARLKAEGIAQWLAGRNHEQEDEIWVLADDSGLEVDVLNGAPGVRSARFAAEDTGDPGNSPDAANNAKLLNLLKDVPADQRTGRFVCVLAVSPVHKGMVQHGATRIYRGDCEGRIGFEGKGENGFGYDPLFLPEGYDRTFGELGDEVKSRLSHRANALQRMKGEWVRG